MKLKRIIILCLAGILLFGCGSTEQVHGTPTITNTSHPTHTPQPTKTPGPTLTPSATPDPIAVVNTETGIRSGPGMEYAWLAAAIVGMELTLIGRKSDCSWLVVIMPNGKEGWINATFITYSMPCELLDIAAIPPTPTLKPAVPPTATPCPGETISILIKNETGGQVTLNLKGPCSYTFSLSTGNTTIYILPGTYSYTAYGCGGATLSGSKSFSGGDEWTWYCQ